MTNVRLEFKWWDALLALLGALLVVASTMTGLGMTVINVLLIAYAPVAIGTRIYLAIKKRIVFRFFRHRWLVAQAIARVLFVAVWVVYLIVGIPFVMLDDQTRDAAILLLVPPLGIAVLSGFLPNERVLIARNVLTLLVTLFFGVQLVMIYLPADDSVKMSSPLKGDIAIVQGGSSPLVNHHYVFRSQRNALDILVLRNGRAADGDPKKLESYGCFGEELHAPLAGTIVKVVSDRPDMELGTTDKVRIVGNHVVLEVAPERFVLFAHMKHESATVREGDRVETGHVIGQCGNSGNTSAPHLHLQVQNRADFAAPDLMTFPIVFDGDARPLRRNDRRSF